MVLIAIIKEYDLAMVGFSPFYTSSGLQYL